MTAAVRALLAAGAPFSRSSAGLPAQPGSGGGSEGAVEAPSDLFSDHVYDYRDHGGTAWAAEALGLDERAVIKTLVMEDERRS